MKFSELQRLQRMEGIAVLSADERIEQLEARLRTITKERDELRAKIEAMELECDAMRTMIQVALEVLDNVRGNINPERGYADELEVDIEHAITTITSLAQRKTP